MLKHILNFDIINQVIKKGVFQRQLCLFENVILIKRKKFAHQGRKGFAKIIKSNTKTQLTM